MKKIIIFIPIILGTIIGILLMDSYVFYQGLIKPPLAPPNWLFPIAWSILYLLMGISYYKIIDKTDDVIVRQIYRIQLFFNLMWPVIFFLFELLLLSSIWIVCLDVLVIIMIYMFYKYDKKASILQIPYLLWILFATYLNIALFILNL
jgi:tryptophan-rich sensory protein